MDRFQTFDDLYAAGYIRGGDLPDLLAELSAGGPLRFQYEETGGDLIVAAYAVEGVVFRLVCFVPRVWIGSEADGYEVPAVRLALVKREVGRATARYIHGAAAREVETAIARLAAVAVDLRAAAARVRSVALLTDASVDVAVDGAVAAIESAAAALPIDFRYLSGYLTEK